MSMAAIVWFGWLGLSNNEPSYRNWNGEQLAEELHPVRPHPMAPMANAMSMPCGRQASTLSIDRKQNGLLLATQYRRAPSPTRFSLHYFQMRCSAHRWVWKHLVPYLTEVGMANDSQGGTLRHRPGIHWTRNENGPRSTNEIRVEEAGWP